MDEPPLTVITVVYEDPEGLLTTLRSLTDQNWPVVQYIVVDGSPSDSVGSAIRQSEFFGLIDYRHGPDEGLYDAMNKGLTGARGIYAVFMNAGDQFNADLDVASLAGAGQAASNPVVLCRSEQRFEGDRYLRPARGREYDLLASPAHQATFYPAAFYRENQFRLDLPLSADGNFTRRAVADHGALFIDVVACRFELGGLSTRYDSLRAIRLRVRETRDARAFAKLALKFILWRLLPQRRFYQLLAAGRYDRLQPGVVASSSNLHLKLAAAPAKSTNGGCP